MSKTSIKRVKAWLLKTRGDIRQFPVFWHVEDAEISQKAWGGKTIPCTITYKIPTKTKKQ